MAEPAAAVDPAHPRNADARSQRQFLGGAFDYFPDDLMAGNQARPKRRKISFHDMKVRATDSAGNNPQQQMSCFECWMRNIFDMKKRLGRGVSRGKNGRFHGFRFSGLTWTSFSATNEPRHNSESTCRQTRRMSNTEQNRFSQRRSVEPASTEFRIKRKVRRHHDTDYEMRTPRLQLCIGGRQQTLQHRLCRRECRYKAHLSMPTFWLPEQRPEGVANQPI